jgi:RHS repeat-associated protein
MTLLQRLPQALLFTFLSIVAFSQVPPTKPTAVPYENRGLYYIDLQNLTVGVNIPVRDKSGVRTFSASFSGTLNSLDGGSGGFVKPSALPVYAGALNVNGLVGSRVSIWYTTRQVFGTCNNNPELQYVPLSGWYVMTADGAIHPLGGIAIDENMCYHSSFSNVTTVDGSGLTASYSLATQTGSIVSANGDVVPAMGGMSAHDSNGNQLYANSGFTTYTDTLGQTALTSSGGTTTPNYSWLDESGTNYQHVVFSTTSKIQSTSWGCASPYTDHTYAAAPFLTNVAYPDGTNIGITYETSPGGTTGRIASLKLRTGGTASFTYSGINCGTTVTPTTTSVMYQVIAGKQWKYTYTPTTMGNTTTVVDPAGNQTIYTFGVTPNNGSYGSVLTQTQVFQGTSTLLSSTLYCYNNNNTNCATSVVSYPISAIDIYTTLGTMTTSSRLYNTFDSFGNLLSSSSYDFGATTPTFTTTIQYGSWNLAGGYCQAIGNNITSKPCHTYTSDAAGNGIAQTAITYDSKGNALNTYVWTGPTGAQWLSSSATYNANGTVATSTDVSGVQTTYTYGTSSCGAFPTTIQVGASGPSSSSTWDCSGGVKLTATDTNGNVTTYNYEDANGVDDPFWRVVSIVNPLINTTTITYSANTTESTLSFGSSSRDTIATVDGYGRQIRSQTKHGSSYDTVSTNYGFNSTGATVSTSVPCLVALGVDCTTGFSTVGADSVGRTATSTDGGGGTLTMTYPKQDVLSVSGPAPLVQAQTELDGLGRPKSLCSFLSTGGTACGQVSGSNSGVLTTFGYSTATGSSTTTATRGVQTRTTVKDALGRTISTSDPEVQQSTGGNTTTTYVYDSFSNPTACNMNNQPGRLILIYDPIVNEKCFQYNDPAGRMTDMVENLYDGSNSVCTRFRFDTATNGIFTAPGTISNGVGHIVEAETDDCTSYPATGTHILSDEWFSYDAVGNVTDVWEKTQHSNGYYHSTATYYANRQIASLGIPGLPTVNYTLDGDGKPYSAKTSSQSFATAVTYGPVGPTNINIGSSTDKDVYGYSAATGKMTSYQFSVNSVLNTGTLNWNANGTLGSLQIVDGFYAADNETCTFIYDDLRRLTSDQCGTPWAQTYSYDIYNNLNQFGSDPFTYTYNPANNHYSTSGVTYDHVGRLTYDAINNYTYNASGKLWSVYPTGTSCTSSGGANCYVYDAFGHMVEQESGGSYTQTVYGPTGKVAGMSGQTLSYAFIPMPGGSQVLTSGASTFYYLHNDWLKSTRTASSIPSSGTGTVYFDRQFAPFSQMYGNSGSAGTGSQIFTGDTHQAVGLFDTPNRELNQSQGRWLTPDPARSGWNQYAYPTDPNTTTDPTGLIQQVILFQTHFTGFDLNFAWDGSASESDTPPFGEYRGTVNDVPYDLLLVNGVNGPTWINPFNGDEVNSEVVAREFGLIISDRQSPILLAQTGGLPPAASGPAQAAKQATRGYPKQTPPPATRPVPDPNQKPEMDPHEPWWMQFWGLFDFSDTQIDLPIFMFNPDVFDPIKLHCQVNACGT